MCFLYMFDMLDFDENGSVCASNKYDLAHARSNFLYLVSKYNQNYLQENGISCPAFFKEELPKLLNDVSNGGNFEKAKKTVLSNCLPKVQLFAEKSKSDRELVALLNENASIKDEEFAQKFSKVVNNLQLSYVITMISGKLFEKVALQTASSNVLTDSKSRSKTFKDIIKYNGLVLSADRVKENSLSVKDFITSIA